MGKIDRGAAVLAACVLFAAGAWLGTAMADRSATAPPIVYTGQLFGSTGSVVPDAPHLIGLSLWDAESGGSELCGIAARSITTSQGYFSISLPDTTTTPCGRQFETETELWVGLLVDGTALDRTRAAAVPYAVTAERLVLRNAAEGVSIGGSYCGVTASRDGAWGGYSAVRAACVAASGCSSLAHVCTLDEVRRSRDVGIVVPSGRVVGPYAEYLTGLPAPDPGYVSINDCDGFSTTTPRSHEWSDAPGEGSPTTTLCSASRPVLCCD